LIHSHSLIGTPPAQIGFGAIGLRQPFDEQGVGNIRDSLRRTACLFVSNAPLVERLGDLHIRKIVSAHGFGKIPRRNLILALCESIFASAQQFCALSLFANALGQRTARPEHKAQAYRSR